MSGAWNHRQYASEADPVRQSDLNQLTSSFGCPKRFEFQKHDDAAGNGRTPERAYAMRCIGTAVHAVIARVLWAAPDQVLRGLRMTDAVLSKALDEEMTVAAEGLPLEWKGKNPKNQMGDALAMVRGALETVPEYASEIVLVEAPFTVEVPSKSKRSSVHGRGTIDLIYRNHSKALAFADWKTGAIRPDPITLHHGYQIAMYSTAVAVGRFQDPRLSSPIESVRAAGLEAAAERGSLEPFALDERPAEAHIVHLRDLVPYARKGKRAANELDEGWNGLAKGDAYVYEKGDRRGRGWYASTRTGVDDARFAVSIATIVGTVRLGRFFEMIGEGCRRCPYKDRCLTEGHELDAEGLRAINRALGDDDEDGLA